MSRAVFMKLAGDLRAEWYDELADEPPGAATPSAASAPLPRRLRQVSATLFPKRGPEGRLAPYVPSTMNPGAAAAPAGAAANEEAEPMPVSSDFIPSSTVDPSSSGPSIGRVSASGAPWEGVPNAPGSGSGHGTRTASASSALFHPAISRVLKVDKLHEPYISKRERREQERQRLRLQQQEPRRASLDIEGGDPGHCVPETLEMPGSAWPEVNVSFLQEERLSDGAPQGPAASSGALPLLPLEERRATSREVVASPSDGIPMPRHNVSVPLRPAMFDDVAMMDTHNEPMR